MKEEDAVKREICEAIDKHIYTEHFRSFLAALAINLKKDEQRIKESGDFYLELVALINKKNLSTAQTVLALSGVVSYVVTLSQNEHDTLNVLSKFDDFVRGRDDIMVR